MPHNRFICIHGHFYQPPRENAWLEEIELQESAFPFHDWNERISRECYAPNGVSRILSEAGKITDIINNYARISFNFGPTLLSWLEQKRPSVYRYILDADRESMERFGGHGSAMAQVYSHLIMPLANRRDKETQIRWGLRDFERRFQRPAQGMWLAETAVDTETLELMAEQGIRYTVLAPSQARQYRQIGTEQWTPGIETRRAYRCKLPSGRHIFLFFYDGDKSQAVAFQGLLNDGKRFATELLSGFSVHEHGPQLVHIATDGETYGHHHRNGDMALAFCLDYIERNELARITNYGEYLELVAVDHEVEIVENSSWSCAHGVERWRSDCGCSTGGDPGWNQQWRVGLRKALDWLGQELASVYEQEMQAFHPDPWHLRNQYIDLILQRSPASADLFFQLHMPALEPARRTKVMRLLEMQRHAMLMFTSCGWFFNDISGIETLQILQYANRAIQYAESESSLRPDEHFRALLGEAWSNKPEAGSGRDIYVREVVPKRLSLTQIGMHYAVNSLIGMGGRPLNVLNYTCSSEDFEQAETGKQILALGRTHVRSNVTFSSRYFSFVILYLGQHNLIGNSADDLSPETYADLKYQLKRAFEKGHISTVLDLIRLHFPGKSFSFFELFKDEQVKMLQWATRQTEIEARHFYEKVYEDSSQLLHILRSGSHSLPTVLARTLETALDLKLEQLLLPESAPVPIVSLKALIEEIRYWKPQLEQSKFAFLFGNKISALVESYGRSQDKSAILRNIASFIDLLPALGISPEINLLQDFVFQQLRGTVLPAELRPEMRALGERIGIDIFAADLP